MARIGIISDTHGRLSDGAYRALAGVDYIIHAGDIGQPHILWDLQGIATTLAVLGNNDWADYGPSVRHELSCNLGGVQIYVSHFPEDAELAARSGRYGLCVHGHTHMPRDIVIGNCRVVNPGSATRPRGGSAKSVILIEAADGVIGPSHLIELAD